MSATPWGLSSEMMRAHGTDPGARWIVATNDINLLIDAGTDRVAKVRAPASG
jgi:hypothetical protein